MASPTRPVQGFTRTELIIALAVTVILVSLAFFRPPPIISSVGLGQMIQGKSNAQQIQIATMSMATDGESNEDPALGWPGDLKARGRIANLSDYVNLMTRKDYLNPRDLKVFSAAGIKPYEGMLSSGSNGGLFPVFITPAIKHREQFQAAFA